MKEEKKFSVRLTGGINNVLSGSSSNDSESKFNNAVKFYDKDSTFVNNIKYSIDHGVLTDIDAAASALTLKIKRMIYGYIKEAGDSLDFESMKYLDEVMFKIVTAYFSTLISWSKELDGKNLICSDMIKKTISIGIDTIGYSFKLNDVFDYVDGIVNLFEK